MQQLEGKTTWIIVLLTGDNLFLFFFLQSWKLVWVWRNFKCQVLRCMEYNRQISSLEFTKQLFLSTCVSTFSLQKQFIIIGESSLLLNKATAAQLYTFQTKRSLHLLSINKHHQLRFSRGFHHEISQICNLVWPFFTTLVKQSSSPLNKDAYQRRSRKHEQEGSAIRGSVPIFATRRSTDHNGGHHIGPWG